MHQFCQTTKGTRRCVLNFNHIGPCSLQSQNSAAVRQINKQEETLKKLEES